jgi:ligand-binding sensor domain-containing protein/two-component sensor histidine kinase
MVANTWKSKIRGRRLVLLLCLLVLSVNTRSEQLPLKTYTTADGLARDQINRIIRDSRGFIWFATPEGLSRFDGYSFTNYTVNQGLPDRHVNDLLETRGGLYWIATGDGVCLFNPTGTPPSPSASTGAMTASAPLFVTYRPGEGKAACVVNVLVEDHTGAIWCGTDDGLYRLGRANETVKLAAIEIDSQALPDERRQVEALLEDRFGRLWIGTGNGLYCRAADGRVRRYTSDQGLPGNFVQALLEDREGRLWVGTRFGGLCQIITTAGSDTATVARVATVKDGLASNWVTSLFESSDHRLWVGTNAGFSELVAATGAWQFRNYTTAQGLSDREVWALGEDRDGSLWLGTANGGAMRLARNGFTTYGVADGLDDNFITSIFEDSGGKLCVTTASDTKARAINQFDDRRFIAIRPKLPRSVPTFNWSWGWNQIVLQDREADWWLATGQGVYRYAGAGRIEQVRRAFPKAIYTTRDGLGSNDVFRLFQDSHGDIWIATLGGGAGFLTRWERATATFHRYSRSDGIADTPTAFCEDGAGDLWIGFYGGGLARYRGGRFTQFGEADGAPSGMIRAIYRDGRGRLWIGSSQGGLSRITDPASDRPTFADYSTADGLASNDVWCITEDQWGRIYAGTGRGLDRLDPQSGHVLHYTAADGLARGKVEVALRDRHGALWFGTSHGLSRLFAEPERSGAPPPVLISGLRIAGVARRVSELGEMALPPITLEPGENDVEVNFVGLASAGSQGLRYQYRLEGADADWCPLTDQRTVNYANLSPGSYRFVVQAVSTDGVVSLVPATVAFTIRRPFWQRGWFILLAAAVVGLVIYAGHRLRVSRLIELERVRMRIATDLHDDIGSSLSRMAILSEVVKQQVGGAAHESLPLLSEMAESSRSLLDAMSDIVWSIDPRRDDLSDLALRIRQFASDVLEAKQIRWDLQIPQEFARVRLSPDQRRQLFLIFKEAITNIARHARCRTALLRVMVAHQQLTAEIHDDGCGFDASNNEPMPATTGGGGNGLKNMRQRAAQVGGRFEIESAPGRGTALRLTIPLRKT